MTSQSGNNSDDITFDSIEKSFVSLLLVAYNFLEKVYLFVLRNGLIILTCTILTGILGYVFSLKTKPVYSLMMIVQHNDLTKRTYAEAIEQLNILAISRSYNQLSQELKLSEGYTSKIKSLKTFNIQGGLLLADTSTKTDLPFVIRAEVLSNSLADSLQQSLLDYFNANSYLTQRKETRKKIYEEKIVFISNELERLDSLKQQYNQFLSSSGKSAMFYNNAFNPAEIYQQSSDYQNERELVLTWLNNEIKTIKLIEGFKPSIKPVDGKMDKIILYFSLVGILLGCFLGLVRDLNKLSKRKPG